MDGLFDWYEVGFNVDAPTTGLPQAGIVHGVTNPASTFLLQPYDHNNVLLLDNTKGSGTLTLATPMPARSLALTVSTGNGPAGLTATVHFSDGTPDVTQTLFADDWFPTRSPEPTAAIAHGRIQTITGTEFVTGTVAGAFNVVGAATVPVIYEDKLDLSLASPHPVSSVDLTWIQMYFNPIYFSHTAVFGLSASIAAEGPYTAAELTPSSFNQDVVLESGASSALPEPATFATLLAATPLLLRRRLKRPCPTSD